MKKFYYKAQAKMGFMIEDTIQAENREAVVEKLRQKGATPIVVKEAKKKGITISIPFIDNIIGRVRLQDKVIFSKNLSRMLHAGLSLSRALEVLKKQSKKDQMKKILDGLIAEVHTGGTLSSGLSKYPKVFSPLFIAMVHAGEESGRISENLLEISAHLDKTYQLRRKVKGAMMYPAVILVAMLVIGVLMFIFVVPTLLSTFKDFDLDLPMSTQIIIFVSDTLQNHTGAFIGGLVAIIAAMVGIFKMKSMKKHIDFVILKIPAIGTIARQLNTALVARTLGSLLGSGLSVRQALEITKEVVQNVHYKKSMDTGLQYIEAGDQLSRAFQERDDIYPVMIGEMVEVGEETGNIVDMLEDVASFYESEVDSKTKNLSTIIEPILMIVIGAAVGFFAIAMMTPMYSLIGGIA